jgi:hypothetical protein
VVSAAAIPFADGAVITQPQTGRLFILNRTGALIWGKSEISAAEELADTYGIPLESAARDVETALETWRSQGLCDPAPPDLQPPAFWPRPLDSTDAEVVPENTREHSYRFLDFTFRVQYRTAALADAIHPRYSNLTTPHNPTADRIFHAADLTPDAIAWRLYFAIVRHAHPAFDPMAGLHSAHLDSIALIANNGSGKSTLAAALAASTELRAHSDDRLLLDYNTGRPVATPNSIGLKRGSWQPLLSRYPKLLDGPPVQNEAEELRYILSPPPSDPLLPPIEHIFFPSYSPAAQTEAIPLNPVEALERIAASESWISAEPHKLNAFLSWLEATRAWALPFSSLDAAIERIEACL